MHAHFPRFSLCALTLLAAAWAPAHAATSTATAAIAHFRYELIDLNLSDGITPSLTFTEQAWSNDTQGAGQRQTLDEAGTTLLENVFGSARGTLSDTTMVSAASLDHSVPLDNSYQSFKNENFRTAAFTLSPHTLLIFTGVGTVSQERAGYFRQASSFIGMDGYMWGEPGGYTQQFRSEYRTQAGSTSMNLYGQLRTDERAGQGHLSLHTYAILAEPLTSPVPEPSTYGMLLAGTFLVGAVARRQRRAVARQAA